MKNWIKTDLKYIWHPYTQMKDCLKTPPILIERASGMKLYDDKGNFYYDTISSWWCNVHGHNHPKINLAIKEQLESLEHVLFAGFTHRGAILLAESLVSIAPKGLTRVFFSDDGSTAVETAMKMSFQYWQNIGKRGKVKFVSLDSGYHGDTIGAMSISGVDLFNSGFKKLFPKSFKIPSPYCYRCPMGRAERSCSIECIEPLEAILKEKNEEITALILEPLLMAAGGMIVYPKEYLIKAARLAKRYDLHLILDEVATGFGRTGRMFACEHAGVSPDFMCLSKGITAGYLPLGVTMTTDKIYRAFYAEHKERKTFYHGHTYTANPLACSAGLASLEIFSEEKTLEKAQNIIGPFHKALERFKRLSMVGDVRYIGLVGAIELVKNKVRKTPFGFEERIGLDIYKSGLKRHLVLRPLGSVVYLFLPLCVTGHDLEYILDNTYSIIESITC